MGKIQINSIDSELFHLFFKNIDTDCPINPLFSGLYQYSSDISYDYLPKFVLKTADQRPINIQLIKACFTSQQIILLSYQHLL